ncbi:hypothetical protein [Flavobacterium cellulosilyticum]|uniref:Uncharacterized protein n=1 Tax=Flavobacterium cellulosilyticum TaxID=2541731 RepID=A0A4R5CAN7_9FLAO|nr:hypothetical protein [Flavobacterium cellulosilyticum]TDD96988.1 hypothetical protein E0F76_10135 [Flavobacterium cellulosilyticum]
MKKKLRLPDSSLFPLIRKNSQIISILMTLAFLNMCISCSYYKAKTIKTNSDNFASKYNSIKKTNRYIIIHSDNQIWHLNNLIVNDDQKEISGSLMPVEESHTLYPLKENQKSRVYKKSKSSGKTLEIHFYTNESINTNSHSQVVIPFSNIKEVKVYEPDTGKKILSIVGFTVASLAVIAIIIAVTKSSCPFIYIKEGNSYAFTGELYPGAVLPSLERTDYLPLPNFIPQNEEYELKISNELLEIQYTDLAQLVVVNHSPSNEVLLDQNGKLHTIATKEAPEIVTSNNDKLSINPSLEKDSNAYLFDEENKNNKGMNTIVFTFDKPTQSNQAKLVLSTKNSLWFDYVYGKFNEQFGSFFNHFQQQQLKVPAEKNIKWRNDQGIPLSVFVKSNNEWVLIEKINPVGPMAFRDLIIPIDLENINSPKIEIKLECGFMFWEVDYAAIDFSKDIPLDIHYVNPISATDEKGKNVTYLLDKEDKNYLIQPNIGNQVVIKYHVPSPKKYEKQTVFLKNRGYYTYIRDYKGIPNFAKLKSFREIGALSQYSKDEYVRFNTKTNISDIVFNHE